MQFSFNIFILKLMITLCFSMTSSDTGSLEGPSTLSNVWFGYFLRFVWAFVYTKHRPYPRSIDDCNGVFHCSCIWTRSRKSGLKQGFWTPSNIVLLLSYDDSVDIGKVSIKSRNVIAKTSWNQEVSTTENMEYRRAQSQGSEMITDIQVINTRNDNGGYYEWILN